MSVLLQYKPFTLAEANKINGNVELGNLLADFQQRNTFLDETPWYPTTHGSYTEEFRAKFLDEGEFTEINAGIPQLGSTGDIIKELVKIYEGESSVDDRLIKFANDPYLARDTRDKMNLEGFLQGFNKRLLYPKNAGDDKALISLTERKGKISDDVTDPECNFVFDAGGTTGALTSAWLFEFGPAGFHMIYNKAGSVGVKNEDWGLRDRPPADGKGFVPMWIRHYEFVAGIVEGSRHSCMRIANITADPHAASPSPFNPEMLIEEMLPYLSDPSGANALLFVPRSVWGQITKALYDKGNIIYNRRQIENYGTVPEIMGVAIRPWDAISQTETVVGA
jgi:hypothetical protein